MYSSKRKIIALFASIAFCFCAPLAKADTKLDESAEVQFSVHPQQCVTLRQGRDCFTTITIQWQKPTTQSLCLYQVNKKQAKSKKKLICWQKNNQGQASVEFESSDNLAYQLRTQTGELVIAETEVVVSWVHKNTSRKRRWRLF